jgi:hypothetical protein
LDARRHEKIARGRWHAGKPVGVVVAMSIHVNRSRRFIAVFGAPIVIAVLTLAGLLAARLFDDFGRYFCWLAVASPPVVCAWAWGRLRVGATRNGGEADDPNKSGKADTGWSTGCLQPSARNRLGAKDSKRAHGDGYGCFS